MATLNRAFRVKNGLNVELGEFRPAAGTTSYPPILLTSGTNLTTATSGAFEYDGTSFYLTASSGGRKTIAFTDTAPASHAHGNITNSGTLTTSVTATSPVKVLITNSSDQVGLLTTTNASNTTFLRGDGTWVTPTDTDTNYYPSAIVFNAGTTAGPTLDLTMSGAGAPDLTAVAIPSASGTASGVVTTGAQTFAGVKTLTQPVIDRVDASGVSAAASLYPTITTGSIAVGSGITTGTVDIGSTGGTVNISAGALSAGTRTVNINTNGTSTSTSTTNIGSTTLGSTITLNLGSAGLSLSSGGSTSIVTTPATSGSASSPLTLKSGNATSANSGNVTIQSGTTTTSGTAGNVIIDTGTSAGTNGTILIGGTSASSVEVGRSGQTTVIKGNLQIDGTTTTVNSTTITVDDKNLVLGNDNTTDAQADGGGITLNGLQAKTLNWVDATDSWTSSENFDIATGKTYKITGADVISGTATALVVGGGASTTIAIGAAGGTATILNPTVTLTNATALNLNGSSPTIATASTGTASVFNTTATTVSLGGQATTLNLGTGTFSTLRTINIGSASSGTGNAQTINLGVNSTTTATSLINIGGSTSTTTTVTGTVKLPTVGTSGFVKLGTGGELSADTNTYVGANNSALTGTTTFGTGNSAIVNASGSTTGTTALTLSTVYASGTYNGGEFIVKATNSTNIEITKVLVITNGTDVYITTYGDVFVSANLVEIDFTYTGANVNMVVTPVAGTTGTTTVKVTGTLVAV